MDPCVSWGGKGATLGGAVIGMAAPGGSYGTAARKGGETAAAKFGRWAHDHYNPGPTYVSNPRLPSGKRPDAVDFDRREVRELKPNNREAIRRGQRQLDGYVRELQETTGGTWTGVLDTYTGQ